MSTISIGFMEPPYESATAATVFRIVDAAIRKGHDVNVFCYEGAVALGSAGQKPHANPVHGQSIDEEDHPNPKDWIAALFRLAASTRKQLRWVNCGLCVDERGVGEQVEGPVRGSPVDAWKLFEDSAGTLWIGKE